MPNSLTFARKIDLDGVSNFRQLGGYINRHGQQVHWGRIYRSSQVTQLSTQDANKVAELDIHLSVDFRNTVEQQRFPNNFGDKSKVTQYCMPIVPGSIKLYKQMLNASKDPNKDGINIMKETYKRLVCDFANAYQKFFELLLNQPNKNIHFNCAAGKDRTGIAAALFLEILDVPRETILQDYLLTQKHFIPEVEWNRSFEGGTQDKNNDQSDNQQNIDMWRPLLTVHKEYLLTAWDAIDDTYGNIQNYLLNTLQLNNAALEQLRNDYLMDSAS